LKAGITIEQFQKSNDLFVEHMQAKELVHSVGTIGRRNRHPIMDTDSNRDQEYFYIMTFLDEDQCNRAVDLSIINKIENQTFICWEDI